MIFTHDTMMSFSLYTSISMPTQMKNSVTTGQKSKEFGCGEDAMGLSFQEAVSVLS